MSLTDNPAPSRQAWTIRELRTNAGEFLRENSEAIQPVQVSRGGASGYLVGEDALKHVLRLALAGLRTSLDTNPASSILLVAQLSELLAGAFTAGGVEISGDDIMGDGLPRTPAGAVDLVALAERIPPPQRPHEELDWGSAPTPAELDWFPAARSSAAR